MVPEGDATVRMRFESQGASEGAFTPLAPDDPREVGGYLLRARIGEGGMGSVYLSYTPGGRPVALKVARAELAADPGFRSRFAKEVQIAAQVQGLYTAPVIDSDHAAPRPWLATAYIPAPSLGAVVARGGPLPADTVLVLVAGIAEALQSIHTVGIVHRDLKPGNVIVAVDGPRVIDFGISRAVENSSLALTATGVRIGTPAFMAPEQVRGRGLGPATDVFALGALAYFAATGELPFVGDAAVFHRITSEEPHWEAADARLHPVLEACMAKDPEDRPSPAQIIELCRQASADHRLHIGEGWLPPTVTADVTRHAQAPVPDLPPTSLPGPKRARRRIIWAALAAGAALVAAGAGIGATLADTPSQARDTPPTGGSSTPTTPSTSAATSASSPDSAASAGPASKPSPSASSGAPDIVRWHGRLDVIYYGTHLDDVPPSVADVGPYDVSWTGSTDTMQGNVAQWTSKTNPTGKECSDLVTTRPEGSVTVNRRGMRLCMTSAQGRPAFATVIDFNGDTIALDLTVWESPAGD
ncbi:serine/threonine-protein kinase [Streptomyces sp. NPDC002758]